MLLDYFDGREPESQLPHSLLTKKDAGKIVLSGHYAETDVKNAVDGKEVN